MSWKKYLRPSRESIQVGAAIAATAMVVILVVWAFLGNIPWLHESLIIAVTVFISFGSMLLPSRFLVVLMIGYLAVVLAVAVWIILLSS